jgi:septal ring factor EnvC (AmiA/AmiB activator)
MRQSNLDGVRPHHHFSTGSIPHPQPLSAMAAPRLLILAASALLATACANPRAEANVASALNDAANEISGLKNDLAQVQTEIDSLRTVVAKQDTTITHLAAVANVPISK